MAQGTCNRQGSNKTAQDCHLPSGAAATPVSWRAWHDVAAAVVGVLVRESSAIPGALSRIYHVL